MSTHYPPAPTEDRYGYAKALASAPRTTLAHLTMESAEVLASRLAQQGELLKRQLADSEALHADTLNRLMHKQVQDLHRRSRLVCEKSNHCPFSQGISRRPVGFIASVCEWISDKFSHQTNTL